MIHVTLFNNYTGFDALLFSRSPVWREKKELKGAFLAIVFVALGTGFLLCLFSTSCLREKEHGCQEKNPRRPSPPLLGGGVATICATAWRSASRGTGARSGATSTTRVGAPATRARSHYSAACWTTFITTTK